MNKLMKKVQSKKGFTLIELIVVIAIIGVLVLLAAPRFIGFTKDAKVSTMQADVKTLANSALIYNIENQEGNDIAWPVTETAYTVTQKGGSSDEEGNPQDKVITAYDIEASKLEDSIKNLKGKYEDYVMTKDGEVFHKKGIEDRKGNKHFGLEFVDTVKAEDADDISVEPVTP